MKTFQELRTETDFFEAGVTSVAAMLAKKKGAKKGKVKRAASMKRGQKMAMTIKKALKQAQQKMVSVIKKKAAGGKDIEGMSSAQKVAVNKKTNKKVDKIMKKPAILAKIKKLGRTIMKKHNKKVADKS